MLYFCENEVRQIIKQKKLFFLKKLNFIEVTIVTKVT